MKLCNQIGFHGIIMCFNTSLSKQIISRAYINCGSTLRVHFRSKYTVHAVCLSTKCDLLILMVEKLAVSFVHDSMYKL